MIRLKLIDYFDKGVAFAPDHTFLVDGDASRTERCKRRPIGWHVC
jgi:hypothetical protein